MKVSFCAAVAALLAAVSVSSAAVVTQWSFNAPAASTTPTTPSVGTGTLSSFATFGSTSSTLLIPLSGTVNGSPGDTTAPAGSQNRSIGVNAAAAAGTSGAPSGSRGLQVLTSTSGKYGISVSWNLSAGFRASRFYQLYVTSDGTNYTAASGGTGSIATNLGTFSSGTAATSATVSNSGLIDIRYKNGVIASNTTTLTTRVSDAFVWDLSYSFPFGSAYENNPNFGFRIAPVRDVTLNDYVSSFAGTISTDTVAGYLSGSAASGGGAMNFDAVTVQGVPEPTGALGVAAFGMLACTRRRRTA